MNPKVTGIILLIVGLGVGLYFITSGAASKLGEIVKTPNGASSSTIATTSITQAPSAQPATSSASSSGFSWSSFFASLFGTHNFSGIPTVSSLGENPSYVSGSGSGSGSNSEGASGSTAPAVTPPAGFTVAQLSPYYQQVRFSGVSQGEISLVTSPSYNTPTSTVDITGWEIKTNRGGEFIPQVQNVYYATGEPVESDLILTLNQNDYVDIYSNSSPANVRVNECMGYLNTPEQFNPGFSYDCPPINTSQLSDFTGACQNYIESLSGCQSPNFSSYYFPQNDYQCEQYLEGKYNYNWCVSTYATSAGFLSNDWDIWMGATPLDPYHDNVELLDQNGLLVDFYSY